MTIGVIRTAWAGTSGGPGITQVYFHDTGTFGQISAGDAQTAVNAMRTFWDAIKAYLPNNIILTVSPVVDQYGSTDGELTYSTIAATPPTSVGGTEANQFSMASGFKINLNTEVIRNGRRVRGAIYVVPAASTVYNTDGAVGSTVRTPINTAGAAFISSLASAGLAPVVWSRPIPSGKPNGPRSGDVAPVLTMETNEKGAILRGRRD